MNLQIILLLAVVDFVSALGVVFSTHETRMQQVNMELLKQKEDALYLSNKQLLIEKGTWMTLAAIQEQASKRYGMYLPETDQVKYLQP